MAEDTAAQPWYALIHAREDLGMTRIALCRATDVSNSMMIDLEAGRRQGSPVVLKRIADYFGLTVTELKASRAPGGCIAPRKPSVRRGKAGVA